MTEIWKDIEGYSGVYQVSNLGRVRSLKYGKERILKNNINTKGYHRVRLYTKGKYKRFLVHVLVAKAFIPNPDDLPQINHIDENKNNNSVENLEWCTGWYNLHYKDKVQRTAIGHQKQVYCVEQDTTYASVKQAGEKNNIYSSNIIKCCKGELKTTGKMHWRYV